MRRSSPLVLVLLLAGLLVALGCQRRQDLRAAEGETVTTVDGYRGGRYAITIDGSEAGEITWWSEGIVERDPDAGPGSVASFACTIENNGEQTLRLENDDFRLSLKGRDGWLQEEVPVTEVQGPTTMASGAVADCTFRFVIPVLADPRRVGAARLHWAVRADEATYRQVTPFVESHRYPGRSYHSPHYHYHPFHHRHHHHPSFHFGVHVRHGYYHH